MSKLVPHPRFGCDVIASGVDVSVAEVMASYWGYLWEVPGKTIFPESAIPADLSRQHYCTFPRGYYADLLRVCRTCGRPFVFFAREQQYWYEELGFYIDADCVNCVECRADEHRKRFHFHRYAGHVGHAADLSDEALEALVSDAVYLFDAGMLRNEQTLRRLKNLAKRRLPESGATEAIVRVIGRIEKP